jgi:hypothetical protein
MKFYKNIINLKYNITRVFSFDIEHDLSQLKS